VRRIGVVLCGALLIFTAVAGFAYDRDEFLFLDEIEAGMAGIGKTIVAGTEIEAFDVTIVGVIDKPGTYDDFIIARASGSVIDRSGGIAHGMSGSPVYIDGKLIGALSRAWHWEKDPTPLFLITPIENMLEVIDDVNARSGDFGSSVTSIEDGNAQEDVSSQNNTTALWVSGLSGRALDLLMDGVDPQDVPGGLIGEFLSLGIAPSLQGLSSYGLSLVPFSGGVTGDASDEDPPLEAGSAFGVALALGDVDIGSGGTITYRDGDTLVGFGHNFLFGGDVAFPLTTAKIYDTISGYDASYKLGSLGEPVGAILEDRWAGIGGVIGPSVEMVDLSYGIENDDTRAQRDLAIQLVDAPDLMFPLLLATGFEAIDHSLDRVGPGTVSVEYRISGDGMPFPLERHDVFLSTLDIALYPPWQLAWLVTILQYNAFADPEIDDIEVEMDVTEDLRAMQINHLELDSPIYKPGDIVQYWVELQTYQGEKKIVNGALRIPEELTGDFIIVRAYSGPRAREKGETAKEFADLGELIQEIKQIPSYDTLTVELFALDLFSPYTDALYGIEEEATDFPSYYLYGEREVSAFLLPSSAAGNVPPDKKR
jgi:hypothetical protein